MQNLLIATNTYSILKMLSLDLNPLNTIMTIDTDYNQDTGIVSLTKVAQHYVKLGRIKKLVDFNKVQCDSYDMIVCSSKITSTLYLKITSCNYINIVFVEDGVFDYTNLIDNKYKSLYKNAIKHVKSLGIVSPCPSMKYLYHFENLMREEIMFRLSFSHMIPHKQFDVVVFTSPLDKDYKYYRYKHQLLRYLSDKYADKRILFKPHPRDYNSYESIYFQTTYSHRDCPGQFLLGCAKIKIYVSPSMIYLDDNKKEDSVILKFSDINDSSYLELFNGSIKHERVSTIQGGI